MGKTQGQCSLSCFDFCTLARQGLLWVIIILNIFSGLDMPPTLSFHNHHVLLLIFILKFLLYVCLSQRVVSDLCNLMVYSPPGSFIRGILQVSVLEWVVSPFSKGSFQPRDQTLVHYTAGRFPRKPIMTLCEVFITEKYPFLSNVI